MAATLISNASVLITNGFFHNVFENEKFAQVMVCDLSNHSNLLDKLNYYGYSGLSLNFFKSYHEDRTQIVCINKLK